MNTKPLIFAFTLLVGSSTLASPDNPCPPEMVNFWKNFANKMDNPDAVPRFLLQNNCFRAVGTTAFPVLAVERLDNPGEEKLVEKLYAQLAWTDGYNY